MTGSISQQDRIGKLTTPFGGDTLALMSLHATEGLSELFEFRLKAASLQSNLDFNSALGAGATVELATPGDGKRYFHGLMTEAAWAGADEDIYLYDIVLRPWLWFLTRSSDSRIFANLNAIDIVKKVFSDRGFAQFKDRTTSPPPKIEYCVQYRETDFAFVSRLMEEWGIYYYFTHSDGKHELVLADSRTSHDPAPWLDTIEFNPVFEGGRGKLQQLHDWSRRRRAQTGKYTLNDYDYRSPTNDLKAESEKPGGYAHDSLEMYGYPGGYPNDAGANMKKSDGESLAKFLVESVQSQDERRTAAGVAPSLFPGALVTLQKNPESSENQQYLVTRCTHVMASQSYRSGQGRSEAQKFSGQYEMSPSNRQFRAPAVTEKPSITGPQSALVVGQNGEEIDVDDLGRVLLQFYWDRKKTQSRRVRVAQIWAGSGRGALFLPRIGDEVMVAYEDGDPDRPIVVGSVYNGKNTVPANLPKDKTHSGILTKSSKGGSGYNMLLFDDTAGSENIKMRSQKDLKFKALGDEKRDIIGSQTENIGKDETVNVGMAPEDISKGGGNFTLNSFKSISLHVGPKEMPLTHIVMDQQSITLSVGPKDMPMSQIKMTMADITLSVGPEGVLAKTTLSMSGIQHAVLAGITNVNLSPASISMMSPAISELALASISLTGAAGVSAATNLQTPALVAGAAVIGGVPI